MLSESGFTINHWITIVWIVAGAAYSYYAIFKDIIDAKKAKKIEE
jgi:hypothetical protein